jgi:AraC-like DNA-binding protein
MMFIQPIVRYALDRLSVKTNVCTLQRSEVGYQLEKRTVPDYNFIFVSRGRVVWVVDQKSYPLSNGDVICVPPSVQHWAYSKTQRITLVSIHVEVSLPSGQDVFDLLRPPMSQKIESDSRLDFYFRSAIEEYQRPSDEATYVTMPHWASLIVQEYIRYNAERKQLNPKSVDPLVHAVLKYLDDCLDRPITLDDLAHFAGVSKQHLNRTFQNVIGTTPLQYLMHLRLSRAAVLLREGKWTVKAVGEAVGFEDPYYFSRRFSQVFGVSPSQYRSDAGSESPS